MFLEICMPHGSKLFWPAFGLFKRCRDRGCCSEERFKFEKVKKWTDNQKKEHTYTTVNTKKLTQYDLNALYTGSQISSHYVYSANYKYLFCVLMFSAGLPILYPFACLATFVLYWVNKLLLFKWYENTVCFNEELPLYAVSLIKYAIMIHGVTSLFMFTNNDLFPDFDPEAN